MSNDINSINSYETNSFGDHLYHITVNIQNARGGWTPVKAISDSGNEISIFKRDVLDSLGFNPNQGQDFNVSGINGARRPFKKFQLNVKIGTLAPTKVTIGFAMNPGDLAENLLGNKDIVKSGKYEVKYSGDKVTYTQRAMMSRVSTCDDPVGAQMVMNNNYDQLSSSQKPFEKKVCSCKDCELKKLNKSVDRLVNEFY